MIISSRGIMLNAIKYGESSLVVKVFTEELGVQAFMAKGVRQRHTTHSTALFSHLSLVELSFRYRENREMHYLGEIRPIYLFSSVHGNPKKGSIILFVNELLLKSIREQEANVPLFRFIYDSLIWFDQQESHYMDFHLAFGIKLIEHLGFRPKGEWRQETPLLNMQEGIFEYGSGTGLMMNPQDSKSFSQIQSCGYQDLETLGISNDDRKSLISSMLDYYRVHLPGFGQMKSLEVLQALFRN